MLEVWVSVVTLSFLLGRLPKRTTRTWTGTIYLHEWESMCGPYQKLEHEPELANIYNPHQKTRAGASDHVHRCPVVTRSPPRTRESNHLRSPPENMNRSGCEWPCALMFGRHWIPTCGQLSPQKSSHRGWPRTSSTTGAKLERRTSEWPDMALTGK